MPKGRQKVDRLAVAQANGYVRGANREKDQHHCETFYADGSKILQERVLSDYIVSVPSILLYYTLVHLTESLSFEHVGGHPRRMKISEKEAFVKDSPCQTWPRLRISYDFTFSLRTE
jgi:hypothetical protein